MKIEEVIIVVFFFGISSYAVYYLKNLFKILNKIDANVIFKTNAYKNYFKTLKLSPITNTKKTFVRANEFITLESILKEKSVNTRLYLAIPSLLVGLGVLGTFIGFSLTVWSVGDILDSSNQLESMKNLFASVKIAFLSSVAGMFWSFIFSKCEKIQFYKLEEKISGLCAQLDESYYLSHEEYIRDFVGKIEETLITDINKAFTKNINDSFEIIKTSLSDVITNLLEAPTNALKIQSEKFGNQLVTWENSINEQNKIIIASTAQLSSLPTAIKSQIDSIEVSFEKLNKTVNTTIDGLATANNEVDDYIKKWLNAIQLQANAIKQQEDTIKNISVILDAVPDLTQELDKVNKSFAKAVKSFQKTESTIAASITDINDSINQAMATIPQLNQTASKIQSSVQDFSDNISTEHREMRMLIGTVDKSIKTMLQGLDSTIEQRLTRTNDLLKNYFIAIDKLSEKIVATYSTIKNKQP